MSAYAGSGRSTVPQARAVKSQNWASGIAGSDRLLVLYQEPKRSDFCAFSKGKRIFDIHSEIANGVLDLAMAQQKLNGPKVACGLVYDRRFGSPERMGSIFLTPQAYSRHPLIDEASILAGAEVIAVVDPARKNIVSQGATTTFEPGQQARSGIREHLELNGAPCFLLDDDRACAGAARQLA